MKGHSFALLMTWPQVKNAEYELAKRFIRAAENLAIEIHIVDGDGYFLRQDDFTRTGIERISSKTCDFLISLHFESARLHDIYSYIALWNPISYFNLFGYEKSISKLASYNDVLSCAAAIVDAHANNIFSSLGRLPIMPLPNLFHSAPEPFKRPRIGENSRVFYIGINWERIGKNPGRHHGLLRALDDADLISIYGPEKFMGVEPWAGFKNYRGSLPFDGFSTINALNEAGICLAFSSKEHQDSGVMSNRFFEGLAAGAALIANPHPFIKRFFSDCAYIVEDNLPPAEISKRVNDIVLAIRRDPSEARERAQIGQKRLKETFSLERCLEKLFAVHDKRKRSSAVFDSALGDPQKVESLPLRIMIVIQHFDADDNEFRRMLSNVLRQIGVKFNVAIICDEKFYNAKGRKLAEEELGVTPDQIFIRPNTRVAPPPDNSRPIFLQVVEKFGPDYFIIMQKGEHWFSDHLITLAKTLEKQKDCFFACTGKILENNFNERNVTRELIELPITNFYSLLHAARAGECGRFLFRTSIVSKIPITLWPLLDGFEHRAIALWSLLHGGLAQTQYASFIEVESEHRNILRSSISDEIQINSILDAARGESRWRDRWGVNPVIAASALMVGLPKMEVGTKYEFGTNGEASKFARFAFDHSEFASSWIDGTVGVLDFCLDKNVSDATLELFATKFNGKGAPASQELTIIVNGVSLPDPIVIGTSTVVIKIPLREASASNSDAFRVCLKLAWARRPLGDAAIDRRMLGLAVHSISATSSEKAPEKTYLISSSTRDLKRLLSPKRIIVSSIRCVWSWLNR